jgi:enoyl-CoA hydratase
MSKLIDIQKHDGITRVTLNRPDALNALSLALRQAIAETFFDLAHDAATEVIILTGAGRAFTVGLDLKELGGEIPASAGAVANLSDAMATCSQPIIGAINGYAITGGFEIALMCDFLIASEAAQFADTHARVGVVPGWGLSQRLPRLIGVNRAKELSLTGNFLSAEQACNWGLVNRVVSAEQLLPVCEQLARDITSTDPATRLEIKRIIDAGWQTTLADGLVLEGQASAAHDKAEVRADKISERRAAIQDRGRQQQDG